MSITSILQAALRLLFQGLKTTLQWTGRQCLWILSSLYHLLKIPEILIFFKNLALQTLKWCGITLATVAGGIIMWKLGMWAIQRLLVLYIEYRERQIEQLLRIERQEAHKRQETAAQAARLRRAAERQALISAQERKIAARKATYMAWEKKYKTAFLDKPTMTQFPSPPLSPCIERDCREFAKKESACKHNVEQFLRSSGKFSLELVKEQRTHWHPDKFSSCRKDLKADFTKRAESLFRVLQPMYEELKRKEAATAKTDGQPR